MESLDDPLTLSDHNSKNVLLTICENSEESQEMVTSTNLLNNNDIQYEIRNAEGVLQYRLLNSSSNDVNAITNVVTTNNTNSTTSIIAVPTTNENNNNNLINNSISPSNCQYFLINDIPLAASRPCLISPKITSDSNEERPFLLGNIKKRDEKRRATHNEVERRRRDKINQWIFKLRDLLPENIKDSDLHSTKSKILPNEYSKGGILIRACEYIRQIKDENESLQECLKENEKLRLENEKLHLENTSLRNEVNKLQQNEYLKILISNKRIKLENDNLNSSEKS